MVPRVSDLEALASSTAGKVEIESLEEGRDEQIIEHLVSAAVLTVFKERVGLEDLRDVLDAFDGETVVSAGEDVGSADYVRLMGSIPALAAPVARLLGGSEAGPDDVVGQFSPGGHRQRRGVRARGPRTCPSASTRKRSGPAPNTAAADLPKPGIFAPDLLSVSRTQFPGSL